jgi:hypothetical protein
MKLLQHININNDLLEDSLDLEQPHQQTRHPTD